MQQLREVRNRVAAAEVENDDGYSEQARADVRWLLSQLSLANNREQRLRTLLADTVDRLAKAPCQDVLMPISRSLATALAAVNNDEWERVA